MHGMGLFLIACRLHDHEIRLTILRNQDRIPALADLPENLDKVRFQVLRGLDVVDSCHRHKSYPVECAALTTMLPDRWNFTTFPLLILVEMPCNGGQHDAVG